MSFYLPTETSDGFFNIQYSEVGIADFPAAKHSRPQRNGGRFNFTT